MKISNLMKMAENSPNGQKEKLLIVHKFSPFPTCFQELYYRHMKNQGLFGKGLKRLFIGQRKHLMTLCLKPSDIIYIDAPTVKQLKKSRPKWWCT